MSSSLILLDEDALTAAEGTIQVCSLLIVLILQFVFVSAATSSVTQQFESGFSRAGTAFCNLLLCKQSGGPHFAAPLKQA